MSTVSIPKTFGALLLGALFASFLSGTMTLQSIIYLKLYPKDHPSQKAFVAIIWILDIVHTAVIWNGLWVYFINDFGNVNAIDTIPPQIPSSIILTAILTLIVHLHYVQRIYHLSNKKLWICAPIMLLSISRVCSGCATSAEMMRLGSYTAFKHQFRWLFSLGLALSSTVDVVITLCLFIFLWKSRSKSLSLDAVIDSLILYTFEIGSLTGLATIISMICWLEVKNNLIFMGLHFVIGKLYANSSMASLNMRYQLRMTQAHTLNTSGSKRSARFAQNMDQKIERPIEMQGQHVQIDVEKRIKYDELPIPTWKSKSSISTGHSDN